MTFIIKRFISGSTVTYSSFEEHIKESDTKLLLRSSFLYNLKKRVSVQSSGIQKMNVFGNLFKRLEIILENAKDTFGNILCEKVKGPC